MQHVPTRELMSVLLYTKESSVPDAASYSSPCGTVASELLKPIIVATSSPHDAGRLNACLPREACFLANGCAYALVEFGVVCCFERGRFGERGGVRLRLCVYRRVMGI
jgi:hypothetical protein